MWGANSVNGVINIITKDPEEDQGLMVTGKAGSKNYRENVTSYSDTLAEKFSYRITGGYREDEGTRGVNDFRRVPKGTGRVKYKVSDNTNLHFFAGVNESEIGLDVSTFTPPGPMGMYGPTTKCSVLNTSSQRLLSSNSRHIAVLQKYTVKINTVRLRKKNLMWKCSTSFSLGKRHHVVWGTNYQNTTIDSIYLNREDDNDDLVGFFIQDSITISDNLNLIAGIKYEDNSFTGSDWSPRGCILYSPSSNHHLRFSVSQSYRTPSFFENSAQAVRTLPPLTSPAYSLAVGK